MSSNCWSSTQNIIIGSSESWKTKSLFNLIHQQPDIDKIYLYAKDPYEAKYEFLIKRREDVEWKHFNDSRAFIEYLNNMNNICKNIGDYNANKKRKILLVFDDMIADMLNNKKLNPIVRGLFIRGRKLNISFIFITRSYYAVPRNIRLTSGHYFIMKILNRKELSNLALSNLSIYCTWKKINSDTEWRVCISWWIIFCIRYSKLFWTYLKKH